MKVVHRGALHKVLIRNIYICTEFETFRQELIKRSVNDSGFILHVDAFSKKRVSDTITGIPKLKLEVTKEILSPSTV